MKRRKGWRSKHLHYCQIRVSNELEGVNFNGYFLISAMNLPSSFRNERAGIDSTIFEFKPPLDGGSRSKNDGYLQCAEDMCENKTSVVLVVPY